MGKIKVLPDEVACRIAAGEIVERPASVVRELVENPIDALSSHIRVGLREGGKGLIVVVTDYGEGMRRDGALLALERHVTGKMEVLSYGNEFKPDGCLNKTSHERVKVNFEKIKKSYVQGKLETQELLIPQLVGFSPGETHLWG